MNAGVLVSTHVPSFSRQSHPRHFVMSTDEDRLRGHSKDPRSSTRTRTASLSSAAAHGRSTDLESVIILSRWLRDLAGTACIGLTRQPTPSSDASEIEKELAAVDYTLERMLVHIREPWTPVDAASAPVGLFPLEKIAFCCEAK